MEAGRMRFLAIYQTPARQLDANNADKIVAWQDRFPVSISIETLKSWEAIKARAVQMNITHKIKCRWREDINADGRFNYRGRIFNIFSIDNVEERNRELEILACEVVKPR